MTSCEKCWTDSKSNPERYQELLKQSKKSPCTPEQQAGKYATVCPECKTKTVHQICRVCMNPKCNYEEPYYEHETKNS